MPSLYIHVPFCVQKCDYCAFYSHALRRSPSELVALYLKGLESEMAQRQKDAPWGVSSLFIGGGTPTSLEESDLEHLLSLLQRQGYLNSEKENSVEGNPGTLTKAKLTCLRRYGINRFSLGVQSFDDRLLKRIGRVHTAREARRGIRLLRETGFANLNLDLMFGLPGQDMPAWRESLEESLSYTPEHLSLYGLQLEEGTPLFYRNMDSDRLPDDDSQADMYDWAVERLEQAGYRHYETSNFALPGYECRHNLSYWRGEDYLGFGPGGVSCRQRTRWKNIEDVSAYYSRLVGGQDPVAEEGPEFLVWRDCLAERVILGLRLAEGVNLMAFKNDFGVDFRDIYKDVLARYKNKDVFVWQGEYLRLAKKYVFIANSILEEFVGG